MRDQVLELIRLAPMGQSKAELLAQELANNNSFKPIPADKVFELFEAYGIPLMPIRGHDYYVYYNSHPSSGYRTTLYVNDQGQIDYKVEPPKGGVFNAFWSEVVVFILTDRMI